MLSRRLMLVAAVAGLATACSPKPDEATKSAAGAGGLTEIRFATDWRAQGEQGGFYQALATGEYEKRGLKVTIIQGGPGVNVPQLVSSGAVQMGMGSNSFITLNLAREKAPVKAVAAFFQKDPQVLIAHPGTGVNSIADMKGRPILLADASVTAFWVWLKSKYGFTDAQVRKYNYSLAPFLSDKRAIVQGYLSSEPYTIQKEAGFKPGVFLLADEGYPGYATMVLAPDAMIAGKPEVVRAFVEASAAGWKSYLHGDASKADALILKDNPEMTAELLANAREQMRNYGVVESGDAVTGGVGVMTDARWAEFFKVASEQGVYPKDMDYKSAYSLDFVGKK
ncbi:ABC transporter substrate-binding protein [Caulobacter mirabilis]|uniref:Nitrate ABC transporter substrate-binding protein n=1 Tax=Caulobacter mirabilis TaxID=69666 RepID=A0A2D2B0U2_9CAUL|nr:ABC transporter substrate-binding protein [Caulobacter mirabilis]ATQ43817.1 nitrate ABC transporter substrate-binding protein [Caulobacter mirabilis]